MGATQERAHEARGFTICPAYIATNEMMGMIMSMTMKMLQTRLVAAKRSVTLLSILRRRLRDVAADARNHSCTHREPPFLPRPTLRTGRGKGALSGRDSGGREKELKES